MFDQIKVHVIGELVPDFVKAIYIQPSLASCELPATNFIKKLAELLVPEKKVFFGEP